LLSSGRHLFLATLLLSLSAASATSPLVSTSLLKTSSTWNGAPIVLPVTSTPEVQAVFIELAPGAATPWHKHPINSYAYLLQGKLRVELESGTSHEFEAGDAIAEVVETWHRGVNVGSRAVKMVAFYTGEKGQPISVPKLDPGFPTRD
jgi:quercetin dioxygenase-like cupin family protein